MALPLTERPQEASVVVAEHAPIIQRRWEGHPVLVAGVAAAVRAIRVQRVKPAVMGVSVAAAAVEVSAAVAADRGALA